MSLDDTDIGNFCLVGRGFAAAASNHRVLRKCDGTQCRLRLHARRGADDVDVHHAGCLLRPEPSGAEDCQLLCYVLHVRPPGRR